MPLWQARVELETMWTFLGQSGEVPLITVAACYDDLKSLIYVQVNVMAVTSESTNYQYNVKEASINQRYEKSVFSTLD